MSSSFPGYSWPPSPEDENTRLAGDRRDIEALKRKSVPTTPPAAGGTRPWIALENTGQTLASGSFAVSLMTDVYYDSSLLTGNPFPTSDTDDYFSLSTAVAGSDDYWRLMTRAEGWFTLELVHLWSNITSLSTSPAYATQRVNFNTTGVHFLHDRQPGAATDWTSAVSEINGYAYIHNYRTIYLPGGKLWPVEVKQTTGNNRDCSGHLKVWYEGYFGSTDGDNSTWEYGQVFDYL